MLSHRLYNHHLLVGGACLRSPPLHVIPNVSGKFEGELPPLHLTHDALVEVAFQAGVKLVVTHGVVARELAPELGDLCGLGHLELKLIVCPVQVVSVGSDQEFQ